MDKRMKKDDLAAIAFLALVIAIFVYPKSYAAYTRWYQAAPAALSFLKFAVLAVFGEMLVARIQRGRYVPPAFGLLPKAVVWGVLGVFIWAAFGIFAGGVTATFFSEVVDPGLWMRVFRAFTISLCMNIIFAPLMMLIHHLSDLHIAASGGRFPLKSLRVQELLQQVNWEKMWGFVYKRTIPLFWIPAHTVTFLLPEHLRVLYAVFLSIVLGLLLAVKR
ncbi:MAG TPA: hypothetical protein ENN41_10760 [Sediminispirochaeta sp.]|nr:hypothetical protein [Sediminispirochaeta sp.]